MAPRLGDWSLAETLSGSIKTVSKAAPANVSDLNMMYSFPFVWRHIEIFDGRIPNECDAERFADADLTTAEVSVQFLFSRFGAMS